MALLEVDNLTIGYQTRRGLLRAVQGVSFSLDRGRSLGFVGESGCGKTTIGMALMSLLPKYAAVLEGQIRFDGRNLVGLQEQELRKYRWKRIAMIFQAAMNALNPVHRVGDQIAEAILAHEPEKSKAEVQQQVGDLFRLTGIPVERMRDYPHQYSGGMKQRSIIAMALACQPSIIIADEPTTALDVLVQEQILNEIRSLQKELHIGILFISHDIAVVADVCHEIAVMYAGQIIEYGTREEVFQTPVHPYTKLLLSSYLTLDEQGPLPAQSNGESPNLVTPPLGCRFCKRCPQAEAVCRMETPGWAEVSPTHRALCCGIVPGRK